VAILITYSTIPKMLVWMDEQAAGEHIICKAGDRTGTRTRLMEHILNMC
jgi:hypothetical protein